MNELMDVSGSMGGGKGGKGSRTPVESNDTLRSSQTIKVLLAIHDGEIDSIENIYLNRTPISTYDASFDVRYGLSNQETIPGFVNTESPFNYNSSEITQATPSETLTLASDVDAVRLTFFVPQLSQYLENGDLVGSGVSLQIRTGINPASLTYYSNTDKSGKSSSEYAWDVLVTRPTNIGGNPNWYVRVYRNTPDSTSVKTNNKTHLASVTQIYYKNLTYPGTALVGITLRNADQFGGQVPEITIKGKFAKVRVPNNYDPVNHTYSGFWDLGFYPTKRFTSNIAWIIVHCLIDETCLNLPHSDIDKASFYELSIYADSLVDDGLGGQIRRYHMGYQFSSRDNVPSFLANLLSICNAQLATNEVGQICIVFDQEGIQPSRIVANSNVLEGVFNYSSNDIEGRTTQVNVTYNNFDKFGDTDTATWPPAVITPDSLEEKLINRYGIQPSDIVLPGCRYEAQAIYKARWAFYTNCLTTRFITFKVMLAGMTYKFGEVLQIMDSENRQVMQHGVITGSSVLAGVTTINLDRDIVLSNTVWTISFTDANGLTIHEKQILQSGGTVNAVTFNGTEVPFIGSTFILNGPIEAKLYKVTGITKDDETYVISGIEHDENKYAYINEGVTIDAPTGDFVNVSEFTVEPVVNVTVLPVSSSDGINSNIQLFVGWEWDLDHSSKFKADFIANWRRDGKDFTIVRDIQGQSFDIDSAVPGTYEINIWAINPATAIKSTVVSTVYNYKTTAGTSALLPPVNARIAGTSGLIYASPAMTLLWDYNSLNDDVAEDSLYDYVVELWDVSGVTKFSSHTVNPDIEKNGSFTLSFVENVATFGSPTREYQVKLYSRDLTGEVSTAYSVTVNNNVPATPSFTLLSGVSQTFVNITRSTEYDLQGYIVYRRLYSGSTWTPSTGDIVYKGPDSYIPLGVVDAGTYQFAVAAYDTFGDSGLNVSSIQQSTTLTAETDKFAYSGLLFTPNSPTTNSVTWATFQVTINGGTVQNVSGSSAAWTSGTLYLCFNKDTLSIETTTSMATAVTKSQILATYEGGLNLKGGDGSAFINGGQILAQSVGANQLVTNSAIITDTAQIANTIITNAHIVNGTITDAKIGNVIQSTGFDDIGPTYSGWKIDKTGNITSYGNLSIKDTAGNDILTTGPSAGIKWDKIVDKSSWVSISGITTTNASTFIEAGAINNLMFDRATGNKLSVGELDIQGNAVSMATAAVTAGTITLASLYTWVTVQTLNTGVVSSNLNSKIFASFGAELEVSSDSPTGGAVIDLRLVVNGSVVYGPVSAIYGEPLAYALVSAATVFDLPSGQDYVIQLQLNKQYSDNAYAKNRYINSLGVKK